MKNLLLIAALSCVTCGFTQIRARAQDNNNAPADNNNNNNNNGPGRGGRGFGRGGGFGDPAQMQQRALDNARDALEVKDDAEWKALEPLIKNVLEKGMEARREGMGSMGRLMFGRRTGGDNGDNGGGNRRFGGNPSPELEALDRAIDAKATKDELKAAIAKLQETRKAKQADLEKAQADLRKVLTTKQEAVATSLGLL